MSLVSLKTFSNGIISAILCMLFTKLFLNRRYYVVVVNVEKVVYTGNKWEQKRHTWYTGYTGLRSETAGARRDKQPERILREAVRRMLPKNKLGRKMLAKLKLFVGPNHPHQAQQPEPKDLGAK